MNATLTKSLAVLSFALALSACCRRSGGSGPFTGNYMSNYGPCSMVQTGARVEGTCPGRGTTFGCDVSGDTIHCDWKEAGMSGKSTATRHPDGKIIGTYGNGASATNGGAWNFTPK